MAAVKVVGHADIPILSAPVANYKLELVVRLYTLVDNGGAEFSFISLVS